MDTVGLAQWEKILYNNLEYSMQTMNSRTVTGGQGGIHMEMLYSSTRSRQQVKASEAILKGLSEDGGLFVPDHIPALDKSLKELAGMTYQQVAYEVMKLYLTDFTEQELKSCIERAYDSKFDEASIVPLIEAGGVCYMELFHGPTIAFKDMALSILPHLMIASARKKHVEKEIVILTATSGDTGKAALAGFADVDRKSTRLNSSH